MARVFGNNSINFIKLSPMYLPTSYWHDAKALVIILGKKIKKNKHLLIKDLLPHQSI